VAARIVLKNKNIADCGKGPIPHGSCDAYDYTLGPEADIIVGSTFLARTIERRGTLLCVWWARPGAHHGCFIMDGREQNGHSDPADNSSSELPVGSRTRGLQKLSAARRRQGLSLRCVAQRLGRTVSEVRAQEEEQADILVSELYRWQAALDVPIEELLAEPEDTLSPRVMMRAQLLKVMKTAMAIRRQARSEAERRLGRLLIEQLLEIMPELKEVSGWPAVGHRRRADEVGRIGENPIPDDWLHEAS
jgi:transcriptional regulator with XRE-family HTH domain